MKLSLILEKGVYYNPYPTNDNPDSEGWLNFPIIVLLRYKIIEEECKKGRVSPNELKGGSCRRKVSTLRAMIAKRGLDELGLSMEEISCHGGMTTSSIAKAVARLEAEGSW